MKIGFSVNMKYFLLLLIGAGISLHAQSQWQMHVIDNTSSGADGVKLADVNHDGHQDIVTGWEEGGFTKLYLHPGSEKVKEKWPLVIVGKTPNVEDAVFADLNNDGLWDIVSCTENHSEKIFVHWNLGKDVLHTENWEQEILPASDGLMMWMYAEPLQIDNKNGLLWLDGKNGFQSKENNWQNISNAQNSKFDKVELIDLDQDGDLDVLICEENFGEESKGLGVVWVENNVQQKWTLDEVQKAIDYCEEKTLKTLENIGNSEKSPRTIPAGEIHWEAKPAGGWTSGFWAGILWYVYEGTGNEKIKIEAEKFTSELKTILNQPVKSHDLGFIFNSSFGNGYRLTGNKNYKKILLIAADSLTHLFNPKVGTILSWPVQVKNKVYSPHNTIIDNMMNLELLFAASGNSDNPLYSSIAVSHADVTMKNHIRPDSTVYHVLVYDDKTGECIRKCTHQGFADNSVWARGQAWGIYGYTMCYREAGDEKYLQTAKELTAAYLKRLPADYVPFWDFDDPEIPNTVKDASAAAIVASALLELSELAKNKTEKTYYRNMAERMLRSLSSPVYLSGTKNDAFLLHSTGNKPKNGEVDIPIIYADYYYIEALVRLKKILTNKKIN